MCRKRKLCLALSNSSETENDNYCRNLGREYPTRNDLTMLSKQGKKSPEFSSAPLLFLLFCLVFSLLRLDLPGDVHRSSKVRCLSRLSFFNVADSVSSLPRLDSGLVTPISLLGVYRTIEKKKKKTERRRLRNLSKGERDLGIL